MSKKVSFKPLAVAVSAAVAGSLLTAPLTNASPFGMTVLGSGYMAEMGEGKCGEGKCGGEKAEEAAEGELHVEMEGADGEKAEAEGKCGEGKCGGDKADGAEQPEGDAAEGGDEQ